MSVPTSMTETPPPEGTVPLLNETALLAAIVATQQEIATSGLVVEEVMGLITRRTQRLTAATGAVLEMLEGDEMVYRAAAGTAAPSLGLRLKAANSLSGLCVRTGTVLRCDDSETDDRVDRAACRRVGLRSMIVVPLRYHGTVVGVLKVFSDRPRAFQDRDADTLQLLAGLLAAALNNATAFASEQRRVAERTEMLRAERAERQKAEESLRNSEELARLLIEGAKDYALFLLDPDGRIATWNSGAEHLFGYRAEEVVGRPFGIFFPPEDGASHEPQEELDRAAARGSVDAVGWRVRKDGTRFWASDLLTALRSPGGSIRGFAKMTRDLTERRRLEEQFRQAQKMEAVGRLAGGVAHDFNNLLTVINGYGHLLLDQLPQGNPARELVQEMTAAGERAAGLTAQLLAFSRKAVVEPKVLDLNEVVSQSVKLLRRLIGEDIALATALAPDVGRVKADPTHLEQIVLNLAVNAKDAMPKGGKLTIETHGVRLGEGAAHFPDLAPGEYVQLAMSDTGTGMTDEVKAHLFEPFFTTKEQGKGTGLGLSVVHGAVKQSGGRVDVYSELGVGTTFKILLPAVGGSTGPQSQSVGDVQRGVETVLLVEDEAGVRRFGRLALETQGYTVLEASGGEEALRVAASHAGPIHLVVTDVVMPKMGGREVAEALRARHAGLKVLYVSGYADDAVVRHGIVEATDAFLQKPFPPLALARKVRAVLDGAG